MIELTYKGVVIPYRWCKKCGSQLPVTDWGRGLCEACHQTPRVLARQTRHAVASGATGDIVEAKRLLIAREQKLEFGNIVLRRGLFGVGDMNVSGRAGKPAKRSE